MKLPEPKAVAQSRVPGYPGVAANIAAGDLLRSCAPKVFSPISVAVAAWMGWGGGWLYCADEEGSAEVKVDPGKVREIFNQYLGKAGFARLKAEETVQATQNGDVLTRLEKSLCPSNPDVLICEDNLMSPKMISAMKFPDTALMREALLELFALYKVKLAKDVPVKGDGYEFCADGWNKEKNIGFEIPEHFAVTDGEMTDRETGAAISLDPVKEFNVGDNIKNLDGEIAKNRKNLFVYPQDSQESMSAEEAEQSFRAFLQSVADYLEWLRQNKRL